MSKSLLVFDAGLVTVQEMCTGQIHNVSSVVSAVQQQANILYDDITKLDVFIRQLQRNLSDTEDSLLKTWNASQVMGLAIQALQGVDSELEANISDVSLECKQAVQNLTVTVIATLDSQREIVFGRVDDISQTTVQIQTNVTQALVQSSSLSFRMANVEQLLANLTLRDSEIRADLGLVWQQCKQSVGNASTLLAAEVMNQTTRLANDISDLSAVVAAQASNISTSISTLQGAVSQLSTGVDETAASIAQQTHDISVVVENISSIESWNAGFRADVAGLNASHRVASEKIAALENALKVAQANMSDMHSSLSMCEASRSNFEANNSAQAVQIQELQSTTAAQAGLLANFNSTLQQMQAMLEALAAPTEFAATTATMDDGGMSTVLDTAADALNKQATFILADHDVGAVGGENSSTLLQAVCGKYLQDACFDTTVLSKRDVCDDVTVASLPSGAQAVLSQIATTTVTLDLAAGTPLMYCNLSTAVNESGVSTLLSDVHGTTSCPEDVRLVCGDLCGAFDTHVSLAGVHTFAVNNSGYCAASEGSSVSVSVEFQGGVAPEIARADLASFVGVSAVGLLTDNVALNASGAVSIEHSVSITLDILAPDDALRNWDKVTIDRVMAVLVMQPSPSPSDFTTSSDTTAFTTMSPPASATQATTLVVAGATFGGVVLVIIVATVVVMLWRRRRRTIRNDPLKKAKPEIQSRSSLGLGKRHGEGNQRAKHQNRVRSVDVVSRKKALRRKVLPLGWASLAHKSSSNRTPEDLTMDPAFQEKLRAKRERAKLKRRRKRAEPVGKQDAVSKPPATFAESNATSKTEPTHFSGLVVSLRLKNKIQARRNRMQTSGRSNAAKPVDVTELEEVHI